MCDALPLQDMLHLMDVIFGSEVDTENKTTTGIDVGALERVKVAAGLVDP